MRVGNRVNEGHAELSLCIYLPDGRIACQFQKPSITANDQFSAGGLTLKVDQPFKTATASYRGEVMLLSDPSLLRDPKRAFAEAPRVQASLDWKLTTLGPAHGGEPLRDDQPTMYGRDFSLGHFNQHTKVEGSLVVGDAVVDHGRLRLARSLLGAAHLAGDPLLPPLRRQLRGRQRPHAPQDHRPRRRHPPHRGVARRASVKAEQRVRGDRGRAIVMVDWTADKDPATYKLGIRTARRRIIVEGKVLSLAPLAQPARDRRQDRHLAHLRELHRVHLRGARTGSA